MSEFSVTHLSDTDLKNSMLSLVTRDRVGTALLLAHFAEFEARKLYLGGGYSSMFAYLVGDLNYSEPAASKRIQAARLATRFPSIYPALACGRLHLSAVCLLAPHMDAKNAEELIEAAAHRSKREVEAAMALRFPGTLPEVRREAIVRRVTLVEPAKPAPSMFDAVPESFASPTADKVESSNGDNSTEISVSMRHKQRSPGNVEDESSAAVDCTDTSAAQLAPAPPPERFQIRVTVEKSTHDLLSEAQVLLSHCVASGDVAQVLDRALVLLVRHLRRKRAGSRSPRSRRHASGEQGRKRYIPAHIRRAVWERDQGQCTFTAPDGHRCDERRLLEFDHVQPFAAGGTSSVDGLRLRCRAHNQYEAERRFGVEFMSRKRRERQESRENGEGEASAGGSEASAGGSEAPAGGNETSIRGGEAPLREA